MKRILLVLCAIVACVAVQARVIEKTYYFSDYQIVKHGDYQSVEFKNTLLTGIAGQPALPYQSVSLLLSPGEKAESIQVICENEVAINGFFKLYPQQYSQPISKGKSGKFAIDESVYNTNADYPTKTYGHLSTQYMNGYGFGQSAFTPLKYNPVTGQVSFYKKVTVRITTSGSKDATDALKNLNSNAEVLKSVKALAQNAEALAEYPVRKSRSDDYQMMVVTGSQYENSFQTLIDLYKVRGILVHVVTTDYINSNITGQDLAEKIRNYIIQEYQSHGVEYVLLGGDVEVVPYRGFYCFVTSGGGNQEDSGIPSDLYYSSLDGNWNTDGDDKWGEIGEDDLLPEIAVARMPFSNSNELTHMLNKTIKYQDSPVLGEMTNPLLAGEHLYDSPNTEGSDYLRMIIGHHEDNGYTTDGITPDNTIDSMYSDHMNWGASDLIDALNTGKSFLHHVGHANETYVMYLSNSDIIDANFYNVNGTTHNYALVYTHGCLCGSFDYDDCIAEKMVTISNFAAAFIGNSRFGWFNEGQTEGPSCHIHREFTDALYTDHILRIGHAHSISKAATSPWVNAPGQWEDGALRWCFYDCNVLGDPAMSIWTTEPITVQATYQTSITIGQTSMQATVTSNGLPVALLNCVLLKDGVVYGTAITDENGLAEITIDPVITIPGDADLVISGNNCLPQYFPVTVVPSGTAYVIYASSIINDAQGNNNGQLDYNENILLSVTLNNVGSVSAENVTATLSSSDPYVTISDNAENYGNIEAGQIVNKDNAFAFHVADNIPDNHPVEFTITAEDGGSWNSNFTLIANAPLLTSGTIFIDDVTGGNGNYQLDPGETATLQIVTANNGHSDIAGLTATLSASGSFVTVSNPSVNIESIIAGNTVTTNWPITVSDAAPVGTVVDFLYSVDGNYGIQHTYSLSIGLIFEDFETGDFSKYEWETAGNLPWVIANTGQYEGVYCAKSGAITDFQTSELSLTVTVLSSDTLSFFRKVSSEDGYDFLRFYIDGQVKGEWSGEQDWSRISYFVTTGEHTFAWKYEKDVSFASGSDATWVDYIVLPPIDLLNGIDNPSDGNQQMSVYPNPCNSKLFVDFEQKEKCDVNVAIFNSLGMVVFTKIINTNQMPAVINVSGWQNGVYYLQAKISDKTISKKILVYQ